MFDYDSKSICSVDEIAPEANYGIEEIWFGLESFQNDVLNDQDVFYSIYCKYLATLVVNCRITVVCSFSF